MKKLSLISFAIMTIMLLTFSCKKNETVDPLYYSNSSTNQNTSLINEFFDNHKPESQHFTLNNDYFNIIYGEQGTRIYLQQNSFVNSNGQTVSGDIDLELIEIFNKKDIILSKMHTMSYMDINNDQDDQILVSGGEFYVNATQNGEKLDLKTGRSLYFEVPADNNSNNMKVFYADESNEDFPNWIEDDNQVTLGMDSNGFTINGFQVDSLNWSNLDRYFNTTNSNPNTAGFKLPSQFDKTNTKVFLSLNNYNSAVGLYYDNTNFSIGGNYTIPVGTEVTVVAISEINGVLYSSFTPVTITQNHLENISFNITTEQDLINQLNNL